MSIKLDLPNSDVPWIKKIQNPTTGTFAWDLGE